MKRKVLFTLINMNIGGTEKAFLNMVSSMSKEHFDITLLLLEKTGAFIESVPNHVRIKTLEEYPKIKEYIETPLHKITLKHLQQGKFIKATFYLFLYFISKINKEYSYLHKYLLRNTNLNEKYDIAIAYAGPMDFISYFVLEKIKAQRKVQWIHFDVTKIGFNKHFAKKYYNKFDRIFVVSKEGKEKVTNLLPDIASKTKVYVNKVSEKIVKDMALKGSGFIDDYTGFRILTVGRLNIEKGQDLAIKAMAKLKTEGINVRWYCIGEGNARKKYEGLISHYGIGEDFHLLGSSDNPYMFMKQCDLYVQPSRHEGFCITLAEAKCFNNPIISTNFTGANEQLLEYDNGYVVEFDEQKLVSAIKRMIQKLEV